MPPLFNPRLVNAPAGDPALFIPFFYEKRALLFDAGDLSALSPRDVLKISHVFITHTHMDHFIGFDQIIRIALGRPKHLHAFGPEGFIDHVASKLGAYSWNLVENYETSMSLTVTEVQGNRLARSHFDCRERFRAAPPENAPFTQGPLYSEPAFTIEAAVLDHDIGCLGYAANERFSVNIRKDALSEMGLMPGPWLYEFKQALYDGIDKQTILEVPSQQAHGRREFTIGALADQLAIITEGKKFAYITDSAFTDANVEKMVRLAENADHLFIEAAFLDADQEIASRKKHLTAKQAGWIAASAGVDKFSLFHYSPRYTGEWERFSKEAIAEFERVRSV